MATITGDTVRALATYRGAGVPVTTCYLDVDGRRLTTHREVQAEFDALVRRAGLNATMHPSVAQDLQRMGRHVRGLRRSRSRGLAMFACSAGGLWEVHELPVPVMNQLRVNDAPCVRQLEHVLDRSGRLAVLMTDRQWARVVVFALGEVVERSEVRDPLVRQGVDDRGERVKTRVAGQRQEQAHHHVKRAAGHAFDAYQREPFERLVIAAPTPDVLADLEHALHPYLRARIVERRQVPIGLSDDGLERLVHDVEDSLEQRDEDAAVTRLRDALGTGRAVAGLTATLVAAGDHRVDHLLVSRGYGAEGWRCDGCGRLAPVGRRCPACGQQMRHVDDVVEDLVQEQLAGCGRVSVLAASADLDVLGRVGALLRY